MDWAALHHRSTGNCATTSRNGVANRCADRTMVRNRPKGVMVDTMDHYVVSAAELGGASEEGIEHRLETSRRARDHSQYLGHRRLLLQRLVQLARSRLHLLKQSRVLDGDHGLVGKDSE